MDNQQVEAGARFDALSALFDPVTFAHFQRIGVGSGWRCWEVGAGSASVPGWLSEQVGTEGRVLATDIDLSWISEPVPFETRLHELGADAAPEVGFDLVHCRLVLVHILQRERAFADLLGALRPGGWLVVEEADPALQPLLCPDESGPRERLANRIKSGFRTLMADRGVDLAYGRTLPRRFREAGLVDVEADAFFPVSSPACILLEVATVDQIRERLTSAGIATDEDVEEHLTNVRTGRMDLATAPLISTWGRKPALPVQRLADASPPPAA